MHGQAMTPHDLRAWREKMRWSQKEAAEKLGMTQQNYSRHELGLVKIDLRTDLACAARAAGLEPWSVTLSCRVLTGTPES